MFWVIWWIGLGFAVFMGFRNNDVYKRQTLLNKKIYEENKRRIYAGMGDDKLIPYENLPNYNSMMFQFWRPVDSWDVDTEIHS